VVYVENQIPSQADSLPESEQEAWLTGLAGRFGAEEMRVLRQAMVLARRAHEHQLRASGEPYISHAVAVADILVGLNLDHETLAAALLHDVAEDTPITLTEIEAECGPAVMHLVDGVTKMRLIREYEPGAEKGREAARAESLRKLLLAMAEDVRVVLIKLADRLHNMRTLKHLPEEKQRRIARETMDIYAPLANRLGIWHMKWELEDLAFRYLDPPTYKQIARFLQERRVDRQGFIDQVIGQLGDELRKAGIHADIEGRPKHIYSIWKKMRRKELGFHEIYDVRAVRILVDTVTDCYHALGIVHSLWPHIPREFDDYIATPKENLYQSIHTAVVGPEGKTLEVQIRTFDMDKHAELGVAAHWRYKEGGKRDKGFEQKIAWLRQLLDWKEEEGSAGDFIDRFKSEVFQDRVYVLTPTGEVMDLPQGATPLDFAYYVHTQVGNRCRGAKVDGRIVPLSYELKTGEQVEILTAKQGEPSRDWLNPHTGYLKTSRARAKVRGYFKQQDHEKNLADGRASVERELHRLGVEGITFDRLSKQFSLQSADEFLIAVGRGDINASQLARAVHQITGEQARPAAEIATVKPKASGGGDIHIRGVGNLLTNYAGCCKPAPGDAIVGYITLGRGVTIHTRDCPNVLSMDEESRRRLIEVAWSGGTEQNTYQVDIEIEAIDRQGLLRDISTVLANEKVNVLATNTHSDRNSLMARMLVTVEVADTDHLSRVLSRVGQLPNVLEARRRKR
jgi:GTP pyrophosphokinase